MIYMNNHKSSETRKLAIEYYLKNKVSQLYTPQFFTIIREYSFYNMLEGYELTVGVKN